MKGLYTYKTNHFPAQIKDVDGKKGIVSGYFSKFDNVDACGDIMRKGAFAKSILETGPNSVQPRIKHILNHNISQPLGALITLAEDTTGLNYESQIGTHALGVDFIKMVESGLITEHSIGYQVVKQNQLQDYDGYKANPALGWFEIIEVKLWEGSSLTAWGCNPKTPITGLKGKEREDQLQTLINRQNSIEKFCRNSSATDDTIELLLIEVKQLTQQIIDLSTEVKATQPVIEATVPDAWKNWAEALKSFNKTQN